MILLPLGFFLKGMAAKSEAQNRQDKPQRKPLEQPTVIIDPGHGGTDPGACRAGVMEKDINLAIAKRVARHAAGCKVRFTRDKDVDFTKHGVYSKEAERQDLDRRIEAASKFGGEVFISIHVNTGLGQDRGAVIYYDADNPGSARLAAEIQRQINKLPGMPPKKPRADHFYLFKHLTIPVIIVETGWLCNPEERERLQDPDYQEQLAGAIGRGVAAFLKTGR
ncbi:N-acetylmuramoyl-L-alanine amidase family protein [Desulforamulus putei]|nr:N-acetylmuramoyl-L-alanine amidase [Desulforamulus putei]